MISKERLEKLIKEGATIYWLAGKMVLNIHLDSGYYVSDANILCHKRSEYEKNCVEHIEYLFETEKQAEWHLNYHATRTEELDLPMWEDWQRVNKIGMYAMSFCDKKCHYCELLVFSKEIIVTKQAYGIEVLFDEPNTEENYEKACDLCVKLFNGEENGTKF